MEIKGKVWCLFEQSGVFKNEFKKLGYESYDVDIQNNFNETEYQIDLFNEIESAYMGGKSLFDSILEEDLIIAFFPCIYFEVLQMSYYIGNNVNIKHLKVRDKFDVIIERINNREKFLVLLYKLFFVCEMRGLRLVLENPATQPNYLLQTQTFYRKPTFIDTNRRLRGDYFKKPTAYWFFNCEPTHGMSFQKPIETKIIQHCKQGKRAGICSEERSLISPDYARNFICDFIIGKDQGFNKQLTMF